MRNMKLPISMIINEISDYLEFADYDYLSDQRLFDRPVFYDTDYLSDTEKRILLCRSENLSSIWKYKNNNILICEESLPGPASSGDTVFYCTKKEDLQLISNKIHDLFTRYENWINSLNELMIHKASLKSFIDTSEKLIGNPISVMGENYRMIVISDLTAKHVEDGSLPLMKQDELLPIEMINNFKNNETFKAVAGESKPFYYIDDGLNIPVLCQNIFFNDQYCGRIIMSEPEHPFRPWDPYLLSLLTDYVQAIYIDSSSYSDSTASVSGIIQALLNGEALSNSDLQMLYEKTGKKPQSQFIVECIRGSRQDMDNRTMEFFRLQIMREFPDCATAIHNNLVVMLQSVEKGTTRSDISQQFALFVRESNFRVGISNEFSHLDDFIFFYEEAAAALQYGIQYSPTIWIHHFSSYSFRYLLEYGSSRIPLKLLKASEISALEEYDREHASLLKDTLKVYLQCNQNASKAAELLHIQRRSFYFRLKKIIDISKLDLDNFERLSYICLSLLF